MLGKHGFASVHKATFGDHIANDWRVLQDLFVAHDDSPTLKNWRTVCVNRWREDKLRRGIRRRQCSDMSPQLFGSLGSKGNRNTSTTVAKRDRYSIRIGASPVAAAVEAAKSDDASAPATEPAPIDAPQQRGRMLLFFLPDTARWADVDPVDGPFFEKLQPIASVAVEGATHATVITLDDGSARVFGGPLDELEGAWRVQAVFDSDFTQRGHYGPGNLISEVMRVELSRDVSDEPILEVVHAVANASIADGTTQIRDLEWITRKSALLSNALHSEVTMRAAVVLPYGYHDLDFPRRHWPTIYVVPDSGGTYLDAARAAPALQSRQAQAAVPQAVWVFLDADTPWGHHGFCDSASNGPVARALVEEFIPFLEERFRLIASPPARVLMGHSSGGWSAVHLAITYPDVFGSAFASAPDPLDFSAFQRTNLYRDPNLFVARDGSETPSFRGPLGPNDDRVFMSVRDEIACERVIDPDGRSGEQWATWDARWSPFDPTRNAPRSLIDADTGEIDVITADAWSKHDIARRVESDFATYAPLFAARIRILCGARDSYYFNEAVTRLKSKLEAWSGKHPLVASATSEQHGFIEIVPGLTHDGMYPVAQVRFHQEIQEHLRRHGLAEAAPVTHRETTTQELLRATPRSSQGPVANDPNAPNRDSAPAVRPR